MVCSAGAICTNIFSQILWRNIIRDVQSGVANFVNIFQSIYLENIQTSLPITYAALAVLDASYLMGLKCKLDDCSSIECMLSRAGIFKSSFIDMLFVHVLRGNNFINWPWERMLHRTHASIMNIFLSQFRVSFEQYTDSWVEQNKASEGDGW